MVGFSTDSLAPTKGFMVAGVMRRRGMTLTDLAVVAGVVALLIAAVVPILGTVADERENRVKCANNLKEIGRGLLIYSNNNKGVYPRVRSNLTGVLAQYTGALAEDPFKGADAPQENDVTAAMFLVVRETAVSLEHFICPSTTAQTWIPEGRTERQASNFPSDKHLSYSITNPYADTKAFAFGYRYNGNVPADFAVMADINPGGAALQKLTAASGQTQMREGNSANHQRDGQNVMFNDMHVEFVVTPFVGAGQDNIYTAAATVSGEGAPQPAKPAASVSGTNPQFPMDSVLVPIGTLADREGVVAETTSRLMNPLILAAALVAVLLVLFVISKWMKAHATPEKRIDEE